MPTVQTFADTINSYLPEPHASLLNGIIFGINLRTSRLFYDQLKIVGLLHLVVLSGINISLLSAIVANLTSFLGKRLSILITIPVIILFIVFVGPKAPIIRAGFMGIFTLVGIVFRRKTYPLFLIFLSLLFIFFFQPEWITSVSLQLSYGATLGIIFFGGTSSKNQIIKELKISLAAQVFTAPIIFAYFKQVSLISPVANLLVAPLIPGLMILGFLVVILGKINYLLGIVPAYLCYGLLSYIVAVVKVLADIPFAYIKF